MTATTHDTAAADFGPGEAMARLSTTRGRRGDALLGKLSAPLVTLLHEREDLRGVYPAADMIDQFVRGGA